jgi:hypothetical protein
LKGIRDMRTTFIVAAAMLLCACARGPATREANADSSSSALGRADLTQPSPVTLRTDRQSYRPSDPITLTITNTTANTYAFNPCTRTLEREVNGAWTVVREDRMCTMIAHILDPNATRTEQTELGADLTAGRYRVLLALSEQGPGGSARPVRAVSAPITITR